jgi:serine phosphatase RsbU (regulator of sigma subunit)
MTPTTNPANAPRRASRPFRLKLAAALAAVIVSLLAATLAVFRHHVERHAVDQIRSDFRRTRVLVDRLVAEREIRLLGLSTALASDELIRTVLTDRTLDRLTRDDIVATEVLPGYPGIDMLGVVGAEGHLLAASRPEGLPEAALDALGLLPKALAGHPSKGFLRQGGRWLQVVARPVLIGPGPRKELLGAVLAAQAWTPEDLKSIQELSGAAVAFGEAGRPFLGSGFWQGPGAQEAFTAAVAQASGDPLTRTVGRDRFLVAASGGRTPGEPALAMAISLDQRLEFARRLQASLVPLVLAGVGLALGLSYLLALGVSRPVEILRAAAERIQGGDFSQRVALGRRDEFGLLARAFDAMQAGLRERDELRASLELAEEVQRHLLPRTPPALPGVQLAGASRPCRQTGGDYFDYLPAAGEPGTLDLVVGDVSGHGVAAALLMATARSLIRSRAARPGSPGEILGDVNRLLAADVERSGSFMTAFYLRLDMGARRLAWSRAGQDPALLYEPRTQTFTELSGPGRALGVTPEGHWVTRAQYLPEGPAWLFIGTDGIWETRSPVGELFGRQRLRDLLARRVTDPPAQLVAALMAALEDFRQGTEPEDDVTLVVARLAGPEPTAI